MADDESAHEKDDVALIHSRTDDGEGYRYLRQRGENLEAGEMRPLSEGRAIHGDVVSLRKRDDAPLYDVTVEHAATRPMSRHEFMHAGDAKPAKVSSRRYRQGWHAIWGDEKKDVAN